MGRAVGEGFSMGNTYKPMADSYQSMAKTTTIKKIKKNWLAFSPFPED